MNHAESRRRRRSKLVLIVGFVALSLAIVRAHFAPAQGYELSIYGATPTTVWVGVAVALLAAVAVTAMRPRGWLVPVALGLAIMATALVLFMPTVRGYFGYGQSDALTHLGWTRGIVRGEMGPMDIFYPGGHSAVGLIHAVTGVIVPRSMMLFVQFVGLCYLVFVPLTVRSLVDDRAGTAIGVFAACLFLPITNVSTYFDFHPYTLTTLFFPVVLFLLFEYLSRRSRGAANGLTATGLLLFAGGVASVLLHGQVALNVLILFGTIAVVQRLYGRLPGGSILADARSLAAPTALFGAFYVVWASRYEIVYVMFGNVYTAVRDYIGGTGSAGESVQNTGESASEVGVSIVELFMKLFFVKTVFVALAAILVLVALAGRLDDDAEDRNEAITYFAYGGLVLGPFFLAHFLGNVSRYFFRHVGFAMVIATILGVVMLHSFYRAVDDGTYERVVRGMAVVAVVVGLLLSLVVVFPSPYIYLPTNGLPEQMHDGYNTTFEYNNSEVRYVDIRGSAPQRYQDALRGPVIFSWGGDLGSNNFTGDNLTSFAPDPYYLPVSEYDVEREVVAYRGGTYSAAAFDSITDESGVSKSLTNGGLSVYYVESSQPPQPDPADGEDNGTDDTGDNGTDGTDPPPTGTPFPEATPEATPTPFPEVTPTPDPTETPAPDPTETPAPTADAGADGDGGTAAGDNGTDGAGGGTGTATDGGATNATGGDGTNATASVRALLDARSATPPGWVLDGTRVARV
jgi:hypothetical protein